MGEWPFDNGCTAYPNGASADVPPEVFYQHLRHNPGDSRALARLLHALWVRSDPRALEVLPVAKKFNPYNNLVLAVEAEASIKTKDWPTAARALTQSVERGNYDAIRPLIGMMAAEESQASVLATLTKDSTWLDLTINSINSTVPPQSIQRFILEGLRLGVMKPETALMMIDNLASAGDIFDAYSLWVGLHGGVPDGLFNGGFDTRSTQRVFDWRWKDATTGAVGMRVRQSSASPDPGSMLEVELTGRAAIPQPMVSQTVVVFGSRYQFNGTYMADRLRTTDGLVWAIRCATGGDRLAKTDPIKDSQRKWTQFSINVRIPPECGHAVKLQLEANSPGEANAGMSGFIYFDRFELKPVATSGDKG